MSLRRAEFGEEIGAADYTFESAAGTRFPVRLRIGKPYLVSDGEWACPAEVQGLMPRLPDARGGHSLQALCLALSLIQSDLQAFFATGGRVVDETGAEYTVDDVLLTLGWRDAIPRFASSKRRADPPDV